jgi:DNA-binding XRE family transcriptional regulator
MSVSTSVPLRILLRRRRQELGLLQAQVAEKLRVSPESVVQWEGGHRRMELGKVPRLWKGELCATSRHFLGEPIVTSLMHP